jgi:hypothetical protein
MFTIPIIVLKLSNLQICDMAVRILYQIKLEVDSIKSSLSSVLTYPI